MACGFGVCRNVSEEMSEQMFEEMLDKMNEEMAEEMFKEMPASVEEQLAWPAPVSNCGACGFHFTRNQFRGTDLGLGLSFPYSLGDYQILSRGKTFVFQCIAQFSSTP